MVVNNSAPTSQEALSNKSLNDFQWTAQGYRVIPVDSDGNVTEYATVVDEVSASITYVGEAIPGTLTSAASWRVKKISVSGTVTTVLYADGDASFDNVWDDRASLSYS